jgi:hypothetical protein
MFAGLVYMRSQKVSLAAGLIFAFASVLSGLAEPGQATSGTVSQDGDIRRSLPEGAAITSKLMVNFGNGAGPGALAVAFTLPPVYAVQYNAGLKILRRKGTSDWEVVYAETPSMEPGQDELLLKKVKAQSGQEALVVVFYHSGAGTTTDWKIITAKSGRFRSVEAQPIREKVLKMRQSTFGGYNGVRVEDDVVVETIPMYSRGMARCCPDRPSIEMRVRFTGTALKLDSVREVAEGKR